MITSKIFYHVDYNAWVVVIRLDSGDEYERWIDAEVCHTAGQALDEALSTL